MKSKIRTLFYLMVLVFGLTVCAPFVSSKNFGVYAQNSISGFVFGLNRQPMSDLNVELMDDLSRTLGRTRTSGSGYYSFSRMSEGRFTIRVYTYGTNYEEQENSVEIQNITTSNSSGETHIGGHANEQRDFYLRLRRGMTPANVVVFVQDIPPDAKKLYEKAVADLDNKRNSEALTQLRSALEIFPKYYEALERLGTEYIKLARPESFQAAEILFAVAIEVNPGGFKSWYGLAYSRYSLNKLPDSLTAAQKAVELSAYSPDAALLYGVLLKKAKRPDEAEKQLLKAKEFSKDTMPSVHWELATLYGNDLNRYADAAKELKLFLKAQPGTKDAEKIKILIADFEAKAQKK